MGRKTIEKNISYDEERKLYYACLNWGKGEDGKYVKNLFYIDGKKRGSKASAAARKRTGGRQIGVTHETDSIRRL